VRLLTKERESTENFVIGRARAFDAERHFGVPSKLTRP
jgi:hypothetical protein